MLLADLGGPTGNKWADVVIVSAAVVGGLGVLWRKVIKPLLGGAKVLENIWHEFHPNDGATMRDSIDRLEAAGATAVTVAAQLAEVDRETLAKLDALAAEFREADLAKNVKLDELTTKVHEIAERGKQRRQGDPPAERPSDG